MVNDRIFAAIRERSLWLVAGAILVAALGGLIGFATLKYQAVASLVLTTRQVDPIQGTLELSTQTQRNIISTQAAIITSRRVAKDVIQKVGLDQDPVLAAAFVPETDNPDEFMSWLIDWVLRKVDVRPSMLDANVMDIIVKDSNPARGAQLVNAFADIYLRTSSDLRHQPSARTATFFRQQLAPARDELEAAQSRLSSLMVANKLVASDITQLDIDMTQLGQLAQTAAASKSQNIESKVRSAISSSNPDVAPDVIQNPVVQNLLSQLATSEAKLREIGQRLGEKHPDYLGMAQQVESLRQTLEIERGRAVASVGANGRISADRELGSGRALAEESSRYIEKAELRNRIAIMRRDIQSAQMAYDTALARLAQSGMESAIQFPEASILVYADTVPRKASSPLVFAFGGGALGILAALMIILLIEQARPKMRVESDFSSLDMQFVGVIGPMRSLLPNDSAQTRPRFLSNRLRIRNTA